MNIKKSLEFEGYRFELSGCISAAGTTTMGVRVSDGEESSPVVSAWLLEVFPDEETEESFSVISCEKRKSGGEWVPASAQDASYELTGEREVRGALIEEVLGGGEIEYRVMFDKEIKSGNIRIAYISGEELYRSPDSISFTSAYKVWSVPARKHFCLYIVVPEGYKPAGACRANVSITKRGMFLVHENGLFRRDESDTEEAAKTVKAQVLGSVKIIASVPLKGSQAVGDIVETCACDCFELCETVGYTSGEDKFEIKDISVSPDRKSLDLTLINAHCGKSVYRLDGEFIVECKRCV